MHSRQNERIPVAKVEALLQVEAWPGTSRGMAQKKGKDGMTKVYQRKEQVCPLCDAVTTYFTTHLQRVHRFKKECVGLQGSGQKGQTIPWKKKRD